MRLWTLALLLVGCEDDGFTYVGPNTPTASDTGEVMGGDACNQISTMGLCTVFVGSAYTFTQIQGNCAGGMVQPDCPRSDVLGVCGFQVGQVEETRTYYYQGSVYDLDNIDAAESTCVLNGGEWM